MTTRAKSGACVPLRCGDTTCVYDSIVLTTWCTCLCSDCRDPLCKYEVSHCVPAPGQNTTSQPWPVEIPGVCCDAGKVGPHCADCGPGYVAAVAPSAASASC